jgi:O-antigen ligase
MLKETIVLGYGPDTYTIEFPQDDVVGKLNSFSSYRTVVDKPHNMYLQIGINTGVISLLAMLSVFMIYLVDSLRILYRKKIESYMDYIGLGLFIGVASYLVAAMFNDQIISVAPLFYGVLGLGMAVNKINRIDFASEK